MQAITPFLWFDSGAEAAVEFWLGVFPAARILRVLRYGEGGPGLAGSVMTIDFELNGMRYTALNGGPHYQLNGAISFVIHCDTQQEIDHYWERLGEGGKVHQCGWLTDRFGVTWQVVPMQLIELLDAPDAGVRARVMQAMMPMVKLDLAGMPGKQGPRFATTCPGQCSPSRAASVAASARTRSLSSVRRSTAWQSCGK